LYSCQFCISVDETVVVRSIIDRCILGLNRCIDVCAEMSRHCKHSSTAETCAIFAYLLLACSECHEILNHEASQSNYCACLSAAGHEAEFMDSAFAYARTQQLLTGTKNTRMTFSDVFQKDKTTVFQVVCLPWPLEHKLHPHMGIGRPPFEEPYGSAGVRAEG
jgi:hypothetical protein